jgi:Chaperone of endosialidase
VSFVFACFGFSPTAQAVSPPPDGGYPNFNTAEGDGALFGLTTGAGNTALGYQALFNNAAGAANTATGTLALHANTTGGLGNTANGSHALFKNTTGDENVAVGAGALQFSTTASFNTGIGTDALEFNTTGNENTATGFDALVHNTTGGRNTAMGSGALFGNTTGERNTAIGFKSLENNTTGSFNVALGAGAGSGVITADDVICIGRAVAGANVGGTCFIGNIRGVTTQNANALPVLIDGAGQLGTASSSQRFKHDIKPMGKASEGILALEPVTFHYKSDSANIPQFGLIAEEVEKVNPDLVVRDENGEIYTVRYEAVNAMLLNEFLKEHREVVELKSTVAEQRKGMEAMAAQLKEQAAQIQKVSAQLEVSRAAPQTVLNNQ